MVDEENHNYQIFSWNYQNKILKLQLRILGCKTSDEDVAEFHFPAVLANLVNGLEL